MPGLGNAAPARGRARPTSRQDEISRAGQAARRRQPPVGTPGGPPVTGGPRVPTGGTPAPVQRGPLGRGPGPAPGGGNGGPAIGRAEQPGLGGQLTRRVQSGALTGAQAQQTMQQRQTLKKAYGSDWRQQVFGGAGKIQQARAQLKANPNDPRLVALNQSLLAKRKQMLEAAQKKGAGSGAPQPGVGGNRPAGPPNPRQGMVPLRRR